jgi:hypothetical protein
VARAGSLRPRSRFRLPNPAVWAVAWLIAGLAMNLSQTFLYQQLWVMQLVVIAFHFCWGFGQTTLFILMLFDGRKDVRILLPVMIFGLVGFFLGATPLGRWGDQTVFAMVLHPAYDRVVAAAVAGELPPPPAGKDITAGQRAGLDYAYAPAQPKLIAFKWREGIPDGGAVLVYDETDTVSGLAFDGPPMGLKAEIDTLVSGHIASCQAFAKPHYFYCSFG